MFDLYLECSGRISKIAAHPETQVKNINSLKNLEQKHNWMMRAQHVLAEAAVKNDGTTKGNAIAERKIEALETISTIKAHLKELLVPTVDDKGNKFFKLDPKKMSFSDAVKAWSKMTDVEMSLLGENKMVFEIRHIVEEKLTVVMELVFKAVQQVADEKVIDAKAVRRIFDVCSETIDSEALGLEGSGGSTD